jgi:hypothetical protein
VLNEEGVFIPQDGDEDTEAEAQMQMGKEESLRDPWFDSDEAALNWERKDDDGVQE